MTALMPHYTPNNSRHEEKKPAVAMVRIFDDYTAADDFATKARRLNNARIYDRAVKADNLILSTFVVVVRERRT